MYLGCKLLSWRACCVSWKPGRCIGELGRCTRKPGRCIAELARCSGALGRSIIGELRIFIEIFALALGGSRVDMVLLGVRRALLAVGVVVVLVSHRFKRDLEVLWAIVVIVLA